MRDEALGRLCGDWPGATCDIKWDHDRVWSVGGKMFCALALDGPKRGQLSFKVDNERFLELTDLPGVHPAPYLARAHWISLGPGHPLGEDAVTGLIRDSYRLVLGALPKKRQREVLGDDLGG